MYALIYDNAFRKYCLIRILLTVIAKHDIMKANYHICELNSHMRIEEMSLSVKSAKRVMKILDILVDYPEGLSSNEISQKLELPPSSTFNLLHTIADSNYLYKDSNKKYRLGPKLIPIGTSALESLDIYEMGMPHLKKLMETVEETVFMAVLSDDELFYIAKVDSNRSIRTTAQPGNRKPLHCTGLGKALLAFMPEAERKRILERVPLTAYTNKTVVNQAVLEEQLEYYQNLGYSIDDEESEEGLYCFAAPVFGVNHELMAAISVAGPKERVQGKSDTITAEVAMIAAHISKDLGYRKTGE